MLSLQEKWNTIFLFFFPSKMAFIKKFNNAAFTSKTITYKHCDASQKHKRRRDERKRYNTIESAHTALKGSMLAADTVPGGTLEVGPSYVGDLSLFSQFTTRERVFPEYFAESTWMNFIWSLTKINYKKSSLPPFLLSIEHASLLNLCPRVSSEYKNWSLSNKCTTQSQVTDVNVNTRQLQNHAQWGSPTIPTNQRLGHQKNIRGAWEQDCN